MNKDINVILSNLIMNCLNIETRENNKKLNVNNKFDQAYLRLVFKKHLKGLKANKDIRITSGRLDNYSFCLSNFNLKDVNDLNKIIDQIKSICNHMLNNNEYPVYLKIQ